MTPPEPLNATKARTGVHRWLLSRHGSHRFRREVVIEATPEEILDVIADVEATPDWSPQYQKAVILESYPDGRPKQVEMTVKAAGLTDVMVIEYTWTDNGVTWTLVKSGQLKTQDAGYTLTPLGERTPKRPRSRSTWRSTCRSRCPAFC